MPSRPLFTPRKLPAQAACEPQRLMGPDLGGACTCKQEVHGWDILVSRGGWPTAVLSERRRGRSYSRSLRGLWLVLLVCRHAGRSRVSYYGFGGHTMSYHAWKRGAHLVFIRFYQMKLDMLCLCTAKSCICVLYI